jgi:tetratricopeptide (TPR) repeat protein
MPLKNKQVNPSHLQQAFRLHQQGQFDRAALCYAAILKAQPNHFEAMHLLGVLRYQQGRQAEALDKIQTALKWKPTSAEALSNLGVVFTALGQPEEALASYDKAIAIRPDYTDALYNRGMALQDLKRPAEGAGQLRQGNRHQARLRRRALQPRHGAPRPQAARGGAGQLR